MNSFAIRLKDLSNSKSICSKKISEFAKFLHHAPSRLTCIRLFVPYAPSYLTCLRALHAFTVYAPSSLICLIPAPYLSVLRAFFRRLARLAYAPYNFLGWICSPAETFHFPRTIKDSRGTF